MTVMSDHFAKKTCSKILNEFHYYKVLIYFYISEESKAIHDASGSFKKIGRTLQINFANSLKLLSYRHVEEPSGRFFDASGCI